MIGVAGFSGGCTIWWYSIFANFFGRYFGISVDVEIQYRIENTTVTVFIQKFDFGITVIFEKIDGKTFYAPSPFEHISKLLIGNSPDFLSFYD